MNQQIHTNMKQIVLFLMHILNNLMHNLNYSIKENILILHFFMYTLKPFLLQNQTTGKSDYLTVSARFQFFQLTKTLKTKESFYGPLTDSFKHHWVSSISYSCAQLHPVFERNQNIANKAEKLLCQHFFVKSKSGVIERK